MSVLHQQPFDAFEIQKCAEYRRGYEDAYTEQIHDEHAQAKANEEASGQFWTVYGHRTNFGVFAISDHVTHEAAMDLAIALSRTGAVDINDDSYLTF